MALHVLILLHWRFSWKQQFQQESGAGLVAKPCNCSASILLPAGEMQVAGEQSCAVLSCGFILMRNGVFPSSSIQHTQWAAGAAARGPPSPDSSSGLRTLTCERFPPQNPAWAP